MKKIFLVFSDGGEFICLVSAFQRCSQFPSKIRMILYILPLIAHLVTNFDSLGASCCAGISEVIKEPVDGWFKLLTQDEGEFYNVPVTPEGTDIMELKEKARVSHLPLFPLP